MTQVTRTVASALAALTLVVGAAGAVMAADPSPEPGPALGAEVTTNIYLDEYPYIQVTNLGDIATVFSYEAPDGWVLTPANMTLGPNEHGLFHVDGLGDEGVILIRGNATDGAIGAAANDRTAIEFGNIRVAQSRPIDYTRYITPVLLIVGLVAGLLLFMRKVKPWQFRLSRVEGSR